MAQPTNTFDSYDTVGIREDLSNVIHDISPEDTPFYSACAKVSASQKNHEWQTDALRASGTNAHIEGDDTVATARTATTRLGNYTQIFKDAVTIPDSDDTTDKAGRGKEMAYQVMKIAKEQKLDIELALFANNAKVAGNSTTARELAGTASWITTNVGKIGVGGSDPTGDGTDARTDGTATIFTQADVDATMQSIWASGGKPDTVYLSSFQMNISLGFTGMNNQRSTVTATRSSNMVVNDFDLYVTPWGNVTFVPSRENRSRDVFIMQSDMWAVANKRATRNVPLAKTGDSSKRQVVTELTLVARNEKASGIIADCTVT
jgi:hypothetical protein